MKNLFSVNFFLLVNICYCDASYVGQIGVQDAATYTMEWLTYFYDYIMLFVITIGVFVCWILYQSLFIYNKKSNFGGSSKSNQPFTHHELLEIMWTFLPGYSLLFIGSPSFYLLYCYDEFQFTNITVKIIGHQWYWTYQVTHYNAYSFADDFSADFEAYMVPTSDLIEGYFRLLEVDNKLFLPCYRHLRLLVTSADVLHSWAVPALGIKIDACPGRLSQAFIYIFREGVFYGQCSEICGVNHGFMPIVVQAVKPQSSFCVLTLSDY